MLCGKDRAWGLMGRPIYEENNNSMPFRRMLRRGRRHRLDFWFTWR